MNNKKVLITVGVVVLVVVGIGFWYWQTRGKPGVMSQTSTARMQISPAQVKESLGSQILGQTQNPLQGKLPPTNPFEKAETNPLQGVYQNPF